MQRRVLTTEAHPYGCAKRAEKIFTGINRINRMKKKPELLSGNPNHPVYPVIGFLRVPRRFGAPLGGRVSVVKLQIGGCFDEKLRCGAGRL
jgi:hypothetical protein